MGITNFPQPFEVTLGRREHAGSTRHGLHHNCGNIRCIMQQDQFFKLICQVCASIRQPFAEGVLGQDGMRNVICINGLAEKLAVETDAPDADAAIVDPVITFDPPDKLGLARQTLVAPVTARHLQSRINGL